MSTSRTCGWCEQPAVTEVIVVPGRKNRKTTPVCEEHASDFEERGMTTTRREVDDKMQRQRNRRAWNRDHYRP